MSPVSAWFDWAEMGCVPLFSAGGPGMGGLSLLVIPKGSAGLRVRKMETQFDSAISTTMVYLDDVRVPARNLIGEAS